MSGIFTGMDVMARALDFHVARQNSIAANVANVDTPGFAPRELVRSEAGTAATGELSLTLTDAGHLAASTDASGPGFDIVEEHEIVPGNDLNYVSLDREMARMTANSVRFEAVAKLVAQWLGNLRYAATDRG
jgi:flagellar basal-body rod protein FlgB